MDKLKGKLSGASRLSGKVTTARASVSISVDPNTITGDPGSYAEVENVGTEKDAILRFTIPRGGKGETGEPGTPGKDGQNGKDGKDGKDGSDGTTFTPSVSAEGVISWTNDGGKENPNPVNIKGQAGNDGRDGQNGQDGQDGSDGTTFTPSVSAEGVISWTNDGGKTNPNPVNIKGPAGQDGQNGQNGQDGSDGTTFTPSVSAEGVISWTNDGGKTNPNPVNIKGPAGDDYVLTTQDKQDIADLVIADLPTWTGGTY